MHAGGSRSNSLQHHVSVQGAVLRSMCARVLLCTAATRQQQEEGVVFQQAHVQPWPSLHPLETDSQCPCCLMCRYGHNVWHSLVSVVSAVVVDCLLLGIAIATACW